MTFQFLSTCIIAGPVTHLFFRRREPNALSFILGLFALSLFSSLGLWYASNRTSLASAGALGTMHTVTYLVTLSMSIACYRLSPWHPLSRFPGPVSARLTKWWMIYQIAVKGGRHVKLRELHAQYGPWVRVGPNEISVNLPCAVRPIYNKLDRSPFYSAIPADADTLITVLDRQVHASRRQAWTKAVTSDAMQSYIPFLMARITQLDRIFDRETSKGPVQIDHWINLFLMDLMGDMGFSGGFETMSAGKDTEGWMEMLAQGVFFVTSIGQVPWMRSIVEYLPRRGPIQSFQHFAKKKVAEIKASTGNKTRRDILGTLLDESSAIYRLNEAEAAADAALIVVAATDTTAQTLAALVPYTMCDRNILSRLQAEVGTAFVSYSGESENMDVSAVMRLPFLDACIQEALRLVPPGPFGPPRTSGSVGVNISDVYIPPNTTIHVPVYTMHRDSANFGPNADDYAPERWLEGSICTINFEGKPKIIKEAFMPFSAGYASCVGKKLALQNMKIFIAWLIHTYIIDPVADFNPEKFDASYQEYGLWCHEPLQVYLRRRRIIDITH